MNSRPYSNGELPYRRPSAIFPSRSPAVIQLICRPSSIHFATLSTGTIYRAPLYKAVAMVEVARSTSMITTVAWDALYKCNSAGDMEVYKNGFVSGISKKIRYENIHCERKSTTPQDRNGSLTTRVCKSLSLILI